MSLELSNVLSQKFFLDDPPSKLLNVHEMKIISNDECWKTWRYIIKKSVICAVELRGQGQNVCHGDSGGPLVIWNGKSYLQVGVSSFTSTTCENGKPSGFARVSHYIDWIERNTQ